eukprot:GHVP01021075.1.p1 GENE.GHVP01021075.1~~GHVP01021075.1.p1  ORF type:complete len:117 (+),score=14.74 GHVP01021075.1:170-520(+)
MELKLLSDQLNSAFEDVTTPQGNVYTLQDELMPSEPAFHGIHHFRFTRASPSFWKINVSNTSGGKALKGSGKFRGASADGSEKNWKLRRKTFFVWERVVKNLRSILPRIIMLPEHF